MSLDRALASAVRVELREFLHGELEPALAATLAGQPPAREVFSLAEVCAALGLSEPTVRQLVNVGELAWIDDGVSTRRITRRCIDSYLERHTTTLVAAETPWEAA